MALIKTFLLIVCTALVSVFLYDRTSVLDTKEQSEKNLSKFIQIKGADELVVSEITGNENFSKSSCTGGRVPYFGWFGGIATCPGPCWQRFSPV